MNTKEMIAEMQRLVEVITTKQTSTKFKDHNDARKASSELKKLAGLFKKQSSIEDKAAKAAKKG